MNYLEIALLLLAIPVVYVGWITYKFLREIGKLEKSDWWNLDDDK